MASTLPLFHLYGDPPDDQAFDFIHVEKVASRSSIHDWTIRAHRHRNLFQILLIERGGGEMTYEAAKLAFAAPAAILVPPAVATVSASSRTPPRAGSSPLPRTQPSRSPIGRAKRCRDCASLRHIRSFPSAARRSVRGFRRCASSCSRREAWRAKAIGWRCAALLTLIAVGVARLAASRARTGSVTLQPADTTVAQLRGLVDEFFRSEHQLGFYAEKLGVTVDRLNDHVKRATGVTAGHLIRQRLLTEAKRQLVFTTQPIQNIAHELAFSDPSHFARFFRKHTGTTPHEFRGRRG
jgi:AraC family transcriptional regulator, transcriptional activator of pobA